MELIEVKLQLAYLDYDLLDRGHNRRHIVAVERNAIELAQLYAPEYLQLVRIAAIYHDIGQSGGRDGHEHRSSDRARRDMHELLRPDAMSAICNAIENHRASNGNPQDIPSMILADADRSPISTAHALMRAEVYIGRDMPWLDPDERLLRAGMYVERRHGPAGYSRRPFFAETRKLLDRTLNPIFAALHSLKRERIQRLRALLITESHNGQGELRANRSRARKAAT